MKAPQYTALELIERLQEEHAKLGNHPLVQIKFSIAADEVKAQVPLNGTPFITIPV